MGALAFSKSPYALRPEVRHRHAYESVRVTHHRDALHVRDPALFHAHPTRNQVRTDRYRETGHVVRLEMIPTMKREMAHLPSTDVRRLLLPTHRQDLFQPKRLGAYDAPARQGLAINATDDGTVRFSDKPTPGSSDIYHVTILTWVMAW